jgi:uncharacterized protein YqjF (DUF2071 family)
MINYAVDPAILKPLVPPGTELDEFRGRTYVSMVGFLFLDTRLLGIPIPFHRHFEEVNLRFYVRRALPDGGGWRRGAVFIREIVPKLAVAQIARLVYNEHYIALPMRHRLDLPPADVVRAEYGWKRGARWHSLHVEARGEPSEVADGSEEEFITEHYWGYTTQRDGGCLEYEVEHPRWKVWKATDYAFDCDIAAIYGETFRPFLSGPASSAFLADGSPVFLRNGVRLPL